MMDMLHIGLHDVAIYIGEAESCGLAREYEAQEKACAACEVTADWQECIDSFGARTVGSFVADWADESEYHPRESSGAALLDIGDGNSLVAYWSDDGHWTVDIETEDRARMALEDLGAEWFAEEEESES